MSEWERERVHVRMRVTEFEVIDHGIEHSQYFQGCGTSGTLFDHVRTGIGNHPADAIEDCLEQIAEEGVDTEDLEEQLLEDAGLEEWPTVPKAIDPFGDDFSEIWYHVSIQYNLEG